MAILPGQKLSFSTSDLQALGREVSEIITDLEVQHSKMFKMIAEDWRRYDAEPLTTIKNTPFQNASNIVIPTIRIHADATVARYLSIITARESIWAGKSLNEEFTEAGFPVVIPQFLNWAAHNEYDFHTPVTDFITEIAVVGSSVLGQTWRRDVQTVLIPGQTKPVQVTIKNGPLLEHIPRERALWDTNYQAWESPVFAKKSWLLWTDLVINVEQNGWNWDAVKSIKGRSGSAFTMSDADRVTREKEKRAGISRESTNESFTPYDIREVWIDWPIAKRLVTKPPKELTKGENLATIVVFIDNDTGTVLHATAKPLAIPGKPFYDAYYKKRTGQNTSPGLGRILRDIQAGQVSIMNQAIDVVTISNHMPGFTTDRRLADQELSMTTPQLINDPKAWIPRSTSKLIGPDLAAYTQLGVLAERLTGISDPALGRETRIGGHPAPATSTLSLLNEGKKLDIIAMRSIRKAISRVGLDQATLYQQLETNEDGKIERAMGQADSVVVKSWLFPRNVPIQGNLELDLAAVSETMSPEVESQRANFVFQATANFYGLVMQHVSVLANPQIPDQLKTIAAKAIDSLSKAYSKILEGVEIDDPESFNLDLQQLARGSAAGPGGPGGGPVQQSALGAGGNGSGGTPGGAGGPIGSGLGQ